MGAVPEQGAYGDLYQFVELAPGGVGFDEERAQRRSGRPGDDHPGGQEPIRSRDSISGRIMAPPSAAKQFRVENGRW